MCSSDLTKHFGVDAFRYYFMRAIPFGSDGSFSWEDMSARYTSELANDFGNLASRITAMIEKYCEGEIPAPANGGELSDLLSKTVSNADKAMSNLDFQGGILAIMEFCKRINLYVTETEPWVLAKDDANKAKLNEVLYNTAEGVRALAVLLHPVMPETCEKLWLSLGAESTLGSINNQKIGEVAKWGTLPKGSKVSKISPLFPRLEE